MNKFYLSLLTLFVITLSFSSCEKEAPKEDNPLIGTKWYADYADDLMVLEFTSGTDVIGYFAKPNGVALGMGVFNGKYTYSNSNIHFSGLTYQWMYAHYRFETATTMGGSILQVNGKYTFDVNKNDWSAWHETFTKQ